MGNGSDPVRTIDFNALPKAVRERLIACLEGKSSPAPILAVPAPSGCGPVGSSLLFFVLLALALVWTVTDFGAFIERDRPAPVAAVAYAGIFFFLGLSALSTARAFWAKNALPFKPGRYLFPYDLVDATTRTLRVVPAYLFSDPQLVHHLRNGHYQHTLLTFTVNGRGKEAFPIYGKDKAEAQVNAFRQAHLAGMRAVQAQDWKTVWASDPFFDVKQSGVWEVPPGPERLQSPAAKSVPWLLRNRALLAGALALLGTPALVGLRTLVNDQLSFSAAEQIDREATWELYVEHGYLYVDEAEARMPVAALREAKQKASVSAVREVLKKYPRSAIVNDARAHLHSLYAKTLIAFREKASGRDPAMLDFMERLLAYLEQSSVTTVRVVFRPPTTEALATVDRTLATKKTAKRIAPIASHFDAKHLSGRQTAIVATLNQAFGQIFPTDVMRLELGTEAASEPALEISSDVRPSGQLYVSDKDEHAYVGIIVDFAMKMRIPGDSKTFGFRVQVEPPERFSTTGTGDEVVYDTMARRAFEQLDTKLQTVFFGARPAEAADAVSELQRSRDKRARP